MPDYYTLDRLALEAELSESRAAELLAKGGFSPVVKNGCGYYSARQAHQFIAALRMAHSHGVSFEEGLQMVYARMPRMNRHSVAR